jgi:hypothetical protein
LAREAEPTTTAVADRGAEALALDEHIYKRLRGVARGVNAGAAAKI